MEKVPQHCPGTEHENAGKEEACQGCPNKKICQSKEKPDQEEQQKFDKNLQEKLKNIKHKILVLSGKGGVGKSSLATQLAFYLSSQDKEVGLLDLDLCGPSIPKTTNLQGQEVHKSQEGWAPVYVNDNLGVISIGFMLPDQDSPVIWRGPKKNGLIQQFVMDVDWGELDYLIVDTPPGTSDEHISIIQYLKMDQKNDGAILISTGQQLSVNDVRKEINFCKKTNVNIIGVVENMKDLVCKKCGEVNELFGGCQEVNYFDKMCNDFQINKIGEISFCKDFLLSTENGQDIFDEDTEVSKSLQVVKEQFIEIGNNLIKNVTQ